MPFNYLVSSSGEGSRNLFADCSLHVLLILVHYQKCLVSDVSVTDRSDDGAGLDSVSKDTAYFSDNPYSKALGNARDIECEIHYLLFICSFFIKYSGTIYCVANSVVITVDRVDIEGNAHDGPLVRLPFASLFDTLGM